MPAIICLGTAWGALSETHDFLQGLIASGQRYPSPTDFIGSVHNAPAGQIAMLLGARGANVTTSGGDHAFEQALLSADVLTRRTAEHILVVGADEYHPVFSPRFDASVRAGDPPADGGGALLLERGGPSTGPTIDLADYRSGSDRHGVAGLIDRLGGAESIGRRFGAVLVGLPAGCRNLAGRQLDAFIAQCRFQGPLIDYRRLTGEVASASAMAAALAALMVDHGSVPGPLIKGADLALDGKGVMVLGLGTFFTALRILPS
jgi:3-oxoacyl-[acyl-carrier-protein] synthase-1/3-oxoacyl-[acyl-carrier-protein] synthase II